MSYQIRVNPQQLTGRGIPRGCPHAQGRDKPYPYLYYGHSTGFDIKTSAHQWLLSEYNDPNVTLSLSTFDAQIEIIRLYENIDVDILI